MKKIYLDHAATSPVKREVFRAIKPYLQDKFGNPSSIHLFGQEARKAVDEAREKIAHFFNCEPDEVIFTSGGTEADNLAIIGSVNSQQSAAVSRKQKPHVITSKIEHHAVLETCEYLEKQGLAEVTYIKVNKEGMINPLDIKKAIKENTILVTIMYANNEVGTIQPIREIGKIVKKENRKRDNQIYFHTDAVQAAGYLSCDVKKLRVHLMTIAGHKIGAPKGIGALCIRKGIEIAKSMHGGEQEYGMRPGTENVAGIVGLGKAVEIIKKDQRISQLRNRLEKGLLSIKDTQLNGDKNNRLPNITNISFAGVEGESILISLSQVGIAASTGSACTFTKLEPSHVIMAMCDDPIRAHSSIRFSLGEDTTREKVDYVIKVAPQIIKRWRKVSPIYKE